MLRLHPFSFMSFMSFVRRAIGPYSTLLAIAALLPSLSACGTSGDESPATVTIASGTQRMVDSLAALIARAIRMSDGCILPLTGGARHTKWQGARGPIERYTQILRRYPDDRGSQWLLNLA